MSKSMQLVVLMGGKASRLAPISFNVPKGLLSVESKPAIFNMLTKYLDKSNNHYVDEIIFIVSPSNEGIVRSFVDKTYKNCKITYIVQPVPEGPLQAFSLAEPHITKHTLLLLGDTLCETELDYSYDWVGYKNIDDKSHSKWCLIQTDKDDNVLKTIDKPDYTPKTDKILIGLYNFTKHELLKKCLKKSYQKIRGEYQLSSLIEDYSSLSQMKGLLIKNWYDTGTLETYNETMKDHISGRGFNEFKIDDCNVLTKISSYEKIRNEMYWLDEIQKSDLKFIIPQYLGEAKNLSKDKVGYKIEYVAGNALSEYFCFHQIPESNWEYIFKKLLKLAEVIWVNKASKNNEVYRELAQSMYIDKTLKRISDWERKDILEHEYVYANGVKYLNFYQVFDKLKTRINNIVDSSHKYFTIIHGDMCFSNVIFIPLFSTFKLIDPRGSFGQIKDEKESPSIYGDYRYDLAKLRHSYHGLYDYINLKMFEIEDKSSQEFEFNFLTNEILNPNIFDDVLKNKGYNLNDIELIEGLLFLSMIPLHKDNPKSQLMYYITGLKCLNNQLSKETTNEDT